MFGNQFICSFEPEANLAKEIVLHQGYLLGGPYHGHDAIFLLNCYRVRWQVEVKQTYANVMSIVKHTLPLVFVPKVYSTSQSDTMDLFIKDRDCEVFIEESLALRFLIMWERLLQLVRITPPTCYGIQIVISNKSQAGIAIRGSTLITVTGSACSLIHSKAQIQA
uniref:Uncharacterized protein n=1 Tax=Tanacetum cinerariifolium TaxID=118510 RepID=A0A6L2MB45_TANCI|nr:hypothetical protein [Tanacetum cinerariifolium]